MQQAGPPTLTADRRCDLDGAPLLVEPKARYRLQVEIATCTALNWRGTSLKHSNELKRVEVLTTWLRRKRRRSVISVHVLVVSVFDGHGGADNTKQQRAQLGNVIDRLRSQMEHFLLIHLYIC